jgi:hypothetical protein
MPLPIYPKPSAMDIALSSTITRVMVYGPQQSSIGAIDMMSTSKLRKPALQATAAQKTLQPNKIIDQLTRNAEAVLALPEQEGWVIGWLEHNLYLSNKLDCAHNIRSAQIVNPSQRDIEDGALACNIKNGKGEPAQPVAYNVALAHAKKSATNILKFMKGEA